MEKIESFVKKYYFLILPVLILPAVWALFTPGFYGASDDMHPAWVQQMDRSLKLSNFPPRMAPDLSFGFGYPLWNFISPLPFYIGEVVHLIGFNFVDSVKIVFGLSAVLAAFCMYLLVKNIASPIIALAAAVLYTYTPYRAVDIYVRGAMGEMWAFVFFPLILVSIIKGWGVVGGLSIAGLILSHNIGTYMFLPFVFVLGLILSQWRKKQLINLGLMFGLGLIGSCYFWLPALIDSKIMRYDTLFNFADHYPVLKQLVTPYWGYGGSHSGPDDGMSFFLGITNLVVLIGGIGILVAVWDKMDKLYRSMIGWSLLVFAISVFMMNYRSTLIWIYLPLLDYFQFPWRFLMMTTVVVPILLIVLNCYKYGKWIALGVIVLAISTTYNYFKPEDFLGRTDEYYFRRYIPIPIAQLEYLNIQEEYLRLPKATLERPDKNYPVLTLSNQNTKYNYQYDGINLDANFNSGEDITIGFNKYYFPGWKAWVNNQEVVIDKGNPFNQMILKIPKGETSLSIKFTEVNYKVVLDILSGLTILGGLLMLLRKKLTYG